MDNPLSFFPLLAAARRIVKIVSLAAEDVKGPVLIAEAENEECPAAGSGRDFLMDTIAKISRRRFLWS